MALTKMNLKINGAVHMVICDPEKDMLSTVLRRMGLTGTKVGCGAGQCGACSVIIDGKVVRSCVKKMKLVSEDSEITTIEGIGTPNHLHPLQVAWINLGGVQCGFCSPGFIVSAYALLQQNLNPTREEVREWFRVNRNACRCTGYKPLVDCVMAAAKVMRGEMDISELEYKVPENGDVYGTSVPRPAAIGKVTGTCDYGDDIGLKMPNALHLAVIMPGCSHARIKSIDTSEAEKMPGVVKVITAKDVKGINRITWGLDAPMAETDGFDHWIIADEYVLRYGDFVGLVAARTRDEARAAAKKVKIDLEPLPEYLSALDSMAPDAMQLHPEHPNIYMRQPVVKGEDTREVFKTAEYTAEGSFRSQRQPHLILEPDTLQAYIDGETLVIHNKTLALSVQPFLLAAGVGWDPMKIRMIENPTGASFGYTLSPTMSAAVAVATIALDGAPVTITLSYEEHQHITGKRAPGYTNIKMGCDENGKLLGMAYEIAYDKGAYSDTTDVLVQKGARFMGGGYYIPNVRGVSKCVMSNHAYSTAYKGFGSPQCYIASEQIMDMLAEQVGISPWEIRYRNVYRPGDTSLTGNKFNNYPYPELLEKIKPYYDACVERAKKEDTPELRRGVGIAIGMYNTSSGPNDHAEVAISINPDGTFTSYNTWQDQGQGSDASTLIHTMDALRPLGVKLEQIKLCMNDTGLAPLTGPSAGSRSNYMAGNAIHDAGEKLVAAMRKEDGTYRTYDEMVAEGIPTKYIGVHDTTSYTKDLDYNTAQGDPTAEYNYAVFCCEVSVDTKTGKVKVLSMHCCADVGVLTHPINVIGQAYGGMEHGIGMALSEDYEDVKKNTNLISSGFPYIDVIPDDLEVDFVQSPRPRGPRGSSGCAEAFQTSPHVAVLNAIYNACGVRIHETPATPAKVLAGLKGELKEPEKYYLGEELYEYLDYVAEHPYTKKA